MVTTDFHFWWHIVASAAHSNAVKKGFWKKQVSVGESLALIHSELSECLEAYRNGNCASEVIPSFCCAEEELADVVLRIMDFAMAHNLDIAGAIEAKMKYNKTRPRLHGKEF